MTPDPDAPLSNEESWELLNLRAKASGMGTPENDRRLRRSLEDLRAGLESESLNLPSDGAPSLTSRVAALESEVRRLKELIEPKNG